KVQGYRIELGEIETALEQHPAVRAAVVVAAGDSRTNRRLVAYVVPEEKMATPAVERAPVRADPPPVPPMRPGAGKLEKLELQLSEPGLRRGDGGRPEFELPWPESETALREAHESRRSQREFLREPVALSDLASLLGTLRQIELAELPFPKYRYPSAGSLYSVQTYVAVHPGGIVGLSAGLYYYDPKEHRLALLAPGELIAREVHFPVNHQAFDSSTFSLFLVGRLDAIEPVYGELALDYSILEAGYMGQLLMIEAPGCNVGLCPIGDLDFARIRPGFDLRESDVLLHSFVGGRIRPGSPLATANRGAADAAEPPAASGTPVSIPVFIRPAAGRTPVGGHLANEIEKLEHKLSQPGLRRDVATRLSIDLGRREPEDDLVRTYRRRSSFREFLDRELSCAAFGRLLGVLSPREVPGFALPKYRYPSAGDLHPVQTYVYVKSRRVVGLEGGLYYYHPKWHSLILLAQGEVVDAAVHYPVNRSVVEGSAFSLFLVGRMDAIAPSYGERARSYCLLEAGYMSQLLMTVAPDERMGLCPVGDLDFASIRPLFDLCDGDIFLHALVGGAVPDELALGAAVGISVSASAAIPESAAAVEASAAAGARILVDDTLVESLRGFLREQLPAYMMPGHFALLEHLPLSPQGKVDRRALPALSGQRAEAEHVPPRSEAERTVAGIWREVLGLEKVGAHDNFFELGGHSLALVRVHILLKERLGREVSIVDLFRFPTVAALARHLALPDTGEKAGPALTKQARERAESRTAVQQSRFLKARQQMAAPVSTPLPPRVEPPLPCRVAPGDGGGDLRTSNDE
ncbi:MAG TPA: nitroreductase family protein, partial [Thermoanaerobaculia bacterium]|nr:nitroreductase family protein [Thermoanaerobaculia bacterium]